MSEPTYRTGQAAKILKTTSSHTIRRLCEAGLIAADWTGHEWRIPANEILRLERDGLPPLPVSEASAAVPKGRSASRAGGHLLGPPSQALQEDAEEVIAAENELTRLRLRRAKEEELDWFRNREARELTDKEERERQREERQREELIKKEREHAAQLASEEKTLWREKWLRFGLWQVPSDCTAAGKLAADRAIRAELARLDPSAPDSEMRLAITACVEEAIRPEREQRQAQQVIDQALAAVRRFGADDGTKLKAAAAAASAIDALHPSSPPAAREIAAKEAVRPLLVQLDDRRLRDQLRQLKPLELGLYATPQDQAKARQAIAAALDERPPGTPRPVLEKAREQALKPIRDDIGRRQRRLEKNRPLAARADLALSHIDSYLRQEYGEDLSAFARVELALKIRSPIKAEIIRALYEDERLAEDEIREIIEAEIDRRI